MVNLIAAWTPFIALGPQSLIALTAVVLIGLPHGAFDGAVALALGYGKTLKSMVGFVVTYVAISLLVVLFWLTFPVIALLLFLAISAVHFGIGDSQSGAFLQRGIQSLAHGGLVVVGISTLHQSEVELIFVHLVGSETELLWQFLNIASFGLIAVLITYLIQAFMQPSLRIRRFELLGLGLAYYFLPPLVGFALYFCAVHSVRHLRYTWIKLRLRAYGVRTLVLLACLFTVISWVAGILMFWLMPTTETIRGPILQIIFIGLAALTVPHMLLVDGIFRRAP